MCPGHRLTLRIPGGSIGLDFGGCGGGSGFGSKCSVGPLDNGPKSPPDPNGTRVTEAAGPKDPPPDGNGGRRKRACGEPTNPSGRYPTAHKHSDLREGASKPPNNPPPEPNGFTPSASYLKQFDQKRPKPGQPSPPDPNGDGHRNITTFGTDSLPFWKDSQLQSLSVTAIAH